MQESVREKEGSGFYIHRYSEQHQATKTKISELGYIGIIRGVDVAFFIHYPLSNEIKNFEDLLLSVIF